MARTKPGYIHMGQQWADGSKVWLTVNVGEGTEAVLQARLIATDAFAELLRMCTTDDPMPDVLLAEAAADYGIEAEGD
jgi:hypothetical protein